MINEILKLASELDQRGLTKEADLLDKIAADIINFEERAKALDPNWKKKEPLTEDSRELGEMVDLEDKRDERRSVLIESFVKKNLAPDTKVYDGGELSELSDYAYNGSEMLREYMIEVIPDLVSDLYAESGEDDVQQLVRDIFYAAESLAQHSSKDNLNLGEDMMFLAKAMEHYLIKQEYDFGV